MERHGLDVRGDNGKRRQCCRADRESLANSCRGISELVQSIGNFAHFFTETRHLGDTARVIRNRTIGIDRHGDTDRSQHTHRGDTHAVQTGKFTGDQDDRAKH